VQVDLRVGENTNKSTPLPQFPQAVTKSVGS